jgi:hypothetical protein
VKDETKARLQQAIDADKANRDSLKAKTEATLGQARSDAAAFRALAKEVIQPVMQDFQVHVAASGPAISLRENDTQARSTTVSDDWPSITLRVGQVVSGWTAPAITFAHSGGKHVGIRYGAGHSALRTR